MGEIHVAVRRVQSKILDFDELNLPEIYRTLISTTTEGLILVCGVHRVRARVPRWPR